MFVSVFIHVLTLLMIVLVILTKKRNFQLFLKNSSHPKQHLYLLLSDNPSVFTFAHTPH
jgi:hypothetical protein